MTAAIDPVPARMWLGMPIPVLALTMCAFCIGTAEFVVMGLLPDIARDLGVSIPLAGQVVTAYALGVTVGAPLLAIATARMPRKKRDPAQRRHLHPRQRSLGHRAELSLPDVARVARRLRPWHHVRRRRRGRAELVPPGKRASAIGLMFTGLTLANILGVPFGTFVGQEFGWRATFWVITGLGRGRARPGRALRPHSCKADPSGGLGREFAVLRRGSVLLAISTTVFASASVFTLFTYIVPILQDVTGFAPSQVTPILLMIGVGLTVGITLGGKFSDRGRDARDDRRCSPALAVALAVHAAGPACKIATLAMIFLWSMAAFGWCPAFQTRVVDKAADAPEPRLDHQHRRLQPRQRRRRPPRRPGHRPRLRPRRPSRSPPRSWPPSPRSPPSPAPRAGTDGGTAFD